MTLLLDIERRVHDHDDAVSREPVDITLPLQSIHVLQPMVGGDHGDRVIEPELPHVLPRRRVAHIYKHTRMLEQLAVAEHDVCAELPAEAP